MAIVKDKKGRPAFGKSSTEISEIAKRARTLRQSNFLRAQTSAEPSDSNPELEKLNASLRQEHAARYEQLMKHYNIDPKLQSSGVLLAFLLAGDFVPNFNPSSVPNSGRPKGRRHQFGPSFVAAVEAKASERDQGISSACSQLSKKGAWKGAAKGALEARYYEDRKSSSRAVSEMLMSSAASDQAKDAPDSRPMGLLHQLSTTDSATKNSD